MLKYRGRFGVTNLLNSTLGLIILPYERGIKGVSKNMQPAPWGTDIIKITDLPRFSIHYFEPIETKRGGIQFSPKTLATLLEKIRHGLAHQHIFPMNADGQIKSVIIENYFDNQDKVNNNPDLRVEFSPEELEEFAVYIADEYLKLYFQIGNIYTITSNRKNKGRRCSIINFISSPKVKGTIAKVKYLDTNRMGKVELYNLS